MSDRAFQRLNLLSMRMEPRLKKAAAGLDGTTMEIAH